MKFLIYQVLPRLYGNESTTNSVNGSITENGAGKMSAFDSKTLAAIHSMGFTHVWFTGVIRHATQTDYSAYGIPSCHPAIVKGKAGSPYAITDYYDVDPDIADTIDCRMAEFEDLVRRTHEAQMKVIIDFVPNHVARQYYSVAKPKGVKDFGADDDTRKCFDPQNNFYYCPDEAFAPYIDLKAGSETAYYESPAKATGNDCFHAHPSVNDWYETVKLNYGIPPSPPLSPQGGMKGSGHSPLGEQGGGCLFYPIPDTWNKMTDILLYWAAKGVDGFRCDMAEMVPVDFWHYATTKVREAYPEMLFIGEVYNPSLYRSYIEWGGFTYLYDKVGMYDTLRGVTCGYLPASDITRAWQQIGDIQDKMLYFLENHDEQRIASRFFADDGKRALPALIVATLMQGNPFMMYMGQSIGERAEASEGFSGDDGRTTIFDYWCVESLLRLRKRRLTTDEKYLHSIYNKVLRFASKEKTVAEGKFFDLMYVNPTSEQFSQERQYAFLRLHGKKLILVCANFDDKAVGCKVIIPAHAFEYLEIEECTANGVEVFTGEKGKFELKKDSALELFVPANFATVWKITL